MRRRITPRRHRHALGPSAAQPFPAPQPPFTPAPLGPRRGAAARTLGRWQRARSSVTFSRVSLHVARCAPRRCAPPPSSPVEVTATHTAPQPDPADPTRLIGGCERYSKFRGLHHSELEVAHKHDATAARHTNSKAVSNEIAKKKRLLKAEPRDRATQTPSSRRTRHPLAPFDTCSSQRGTAKSVAACPERVEY